MSKVLLLPGDGIGPEVIAQAKKVLLHLQSAHGLNIELEEALIGGSAYDDCKNPLPDTTLELAKNSDAILLGAVGGPKYDAVERELLSFLSSSHSVRASCRCTSFPCTSSRNK